MFDHADDEPGVIASPLAYAPPVRFKLVVEVPPSVVRMLMEAPAAAGSLGDIVKTLVTNSHAQAAAAKRAADRVDELAEDVRSLDAKFADAVRAAAGFDPPAPDTNHPPAEPGEHRGNPWGDDSPRDVM